MSLQVVRQNVSKATFDQHMMRVLLNQASDGPVETAPQMHSILAAGRGEHQFPRRYNPENGGYTPRASPRSVVSASFISRTSTLSEIPAFCLVNNVSLALLTGLRPFHYIEASLMQYLCLISGLENYHLAN
jgi:hypothetical protein